MTGPMKPKDFKLPDNYLKMSEDEIDEACGDEAYRVKFYRKLDRHILRKTTDWLESRDNKGPTFSCGAFSCSCGAMYGGISHDERFVCRQCFQGYVCER